MALKFMDLDLFPIAEVNQALKEKIYYNYFREVDEHYMKAESKSVRSFIFDKKTYDKAKAETWLKERGIETLDFSENSSDLQLGVRKYDDFIMADLYDSLTVAEGVSMMVKKLTPDALFVAQVWTNFEKIVKPQGGKFCVYSKDGKKKLGCHDTKEQALDQLKAIEASKHEVKKNLEKLVEAVKLLEAPSPEKIQEAVSLIKMCIEEYDSGPAKILDEAAEYVKSETIVKAMEDGSLSFQTSIPFLKALDEDKRLVLGVVYAPDKVDSQGDYATADEIEKGCHNFMIDSRRVGIMHKTDAGDRAHIVENYITQCEMRIGNERISKGTWIMGLKIADDQLWADIKSGKLTGLSMGGKARAG